MGFIALLRTSYIESPVADETVWHKRLRAPFFAKINGANPSGQIWRRKYNGRWEYRQDAETVEDRDRRAW